MTRLLQVEVLRLVRRRAVLVLVAVAFVVPAVIAIGVVIDTRPPSAAEVAEAERYVAEERESGWYQREMERCERRPGRYGIDDSASPEEVREQCEWNYGLTVDSYLYHEPLDLAREREEGSGIAVATVLAIVMLLVGTTFSGHDWASGSVSNQLLFVPQRLRVWLAKAIVVTASAVAVAAVAMTAYWLALDAVARTDEPSGDGVLLDALQMGWRSALIAGGVALGGYALTMLFRSTVAALGILLALGIAGGTVLAVVGVDSVWNPGLNLAAVMLDGASYYVEVPCPVGEGTGCTEERVLSLQRGAVYVGALLAAMAAVSMASFNRRDVP